MQLLDFLEHEQHSTISRRNLLILFASAAISSHLSSSCEERSTRGEFSAGEKARIDRFVRHLNSPEKNELQKRFVDYLHAYKIYNQVHVPLDEKELFYKFYGLLSSYCPRFEYKEESYMEGGSRAFVEKQPGTQNYTIGYLPNEYVDDERSLHPDEIFRYNIYKITEPQKYKKSCCPLTNLKQLIAEVAHLIHFAAYLTENFSYMYELAILEDFFPGFKSLGNSKQDKDVEQALMDEIMYRHCDFEEFYSHTVLERAIWFYLLDILPDKQFEEIKAAFITIFKRVKDCSQLASPFGKAAIISAICMPDLVKAIMTQRMSISSYIDFILLGVEPLKKVIQQHEINIDPEYLFFELLHNTSTPEGLDTLLQMDAFIQETQKIVEVIAGYQRSQERFGALPVPQKIFASILLKSSQYASVNVPDYIQKYADIGSFDAIPQHLAQINRNFQKGKTTK